jgi:hypothetical protein
MPPENESEDLKRESRDSANLTATIFAIVVSGTACVFNIVGRNGLELGALTTMRLFSLCLILICAPKILGTLWTQYKRINNFKHPDSIVASDSFAILTMLFVVVLLSYLSAPPHLSRQIVLADLPLIAVAGFGAAGTIADFLACKQRAALRWFIPLSLSFAVWCAAKQFHPFFFEEISLGTAYVDTLFDCAVANMYRAYNTSTLGYDGIAIFHYHSGSQWLFSRLADLLNVDMVNFLGKGQLIVLVPLFFKAFFTAVFDLSEVLAPDFFNINTSKSSQFWILFVTGVIGILPVDVAAKMGMSWYTFLLTNSYTVALTILCILISFAVKFHNQARRDDTSATFRSRLLICALMPLLALLNGLVKQSFLYCLTVWFCYCFLRLRLYKKKEYVFAAALHIVLCLFAVTLVVYTNSNPPGFLDFFRTYVSPNLYALYPFAYYFWFWMLLLVLIAKLKSKSFGSICAAIRSRYFFVIESLLVVILASQVPPNLLAIQGGSGILFLEPPQWISFALGLAILPNLRSVLCGPLSTSSVANNYRPKLIVVAIITCTLLAALNFSTTFNEGLTDYLTMRARIAFSPDASKVNATTSSIIDLSVALKKLRFRRAFSLFFAIWNKVDCNLIANLKHYEPYQLISTLASAEFYPDKSHTLMYIPRPIQIYWHLIDCRFVGMISPSVSGMASLVGLPSPECKTKYFGTETYPKPQINSLGYSPVKVLEDQEIATLTKARGFSKVIILNDTQQNPTLRLLDCDTLKVQSLSELQRH